MRPYGRPSDDFCFRLLSGPHLNRRVPSDQVQGSTPRVTSCPTEGKRFQANPLAFLSSLRLKQVMSSPFIIAIDGPAASGKGTMARRIAGEFGFAHLDTGLTYRAVARALLDEGLPLDDEALAEEYARRVDLSALDRDALSTHEVGEAASKVAVMPAVRRAAILEDIRRRDERDMNRADSPLKPAPDAHLLDTSEMDIETAFRAAKAYVDEALAKRNGG